MLAALARDLRTGRRTARDVVEESLAAIAARDPALNAFITVLADDARAAAAAADAALAQGDDRGPLHGLPISIKDVIDVGGVSTTAASRVRATHRAAADADVVARLRAAGAVVIGKCNLHEFAFGTTGTDSAYGPTRNPHRESYIPGGSSSGSAVSVAAGMAVASIGTDTGGSIRIPASACGVVGLKPTFGEVDVGGVVPLAPTLDHVGPLTRTVADAVVVHAVIRRSRRGQPDAPPDPPARPRYGIPRRYFFDVMAPEVGRRFDETVRRLEAAGGRVLDVDVPHAPETATVYRHTQLPEAAVVHHATLDSRADDYLPAVRARLELGRTVAATDYLLAQQVRRTLTAEVDAALAGCDALLLPTLPILPPRIGADTIEVGRTTDSVRALTLRLTQLFDLTGHPAVSLPCGMVEGLPVGLQLVGRRHRTDDLLALARRIESRLDGC